MRFGCCGNMITKGTGIEIIEKLEEVGYDYIELSLSHIEQLSEIEYLNLKNKLIRSNLKCEACNNFFPSYIKLTGSKIDWNIIKIYLNKALMRANELGTKIVVFGSGLARNVPMGYSINNARKQLVHLLRYISKIINKYEIIIAIEPLRKKESNIINSVNGALELAKEVNRDNINVLVDYYHLSYEKENPKIIRKAKKYIQHIHLANSIGRIFPKHISEDNYIPFIESLKAIHYNKRISIEAYTNNFYEDCKNTLQFLHEYFS